jgi:hypothetical protein
MSGRLDDSFKHADPTDLSEPVEHPKTLPMDVLSVIEQCWEYMDQRADISHETDDDGSPRPNEEMVLMSELQTILERCDR